MADSALPPPPLTPPSQLFSFTDWSISHPQAPPPGDRLDAQFNEVTRAIQILIERLKFLTRDDGQLTNYSVGLNSLDQGLAALIIQGQQPLVPPPDINQAINDAYAARDAVQASREAIEAIAHDVANHVIDAAQANDKAQEALLAAADARNAAIAIANQFPAAQAELNALLSSDIRTTSSATDAEQLAWKWAEKLDGPVLTEAEYAAIDPALKPPGYQYNPVGGVNGLWSSHWWSIQARDAVGDASSEADRAEAAADDAAAALDQFTDLYLGPHPANPTLDNDGNPLQVGAVYYNTNDGNMYVWSGTQWTVSSSAKGWVPEAPIDSHTYVRGNASWLLSAGGIGEAPNDTKAYARKSVAWSQLNSNDVVFDTGPLYVTGAINLKADQTALITETNARIAGDQANIASINNLKASGVANDSSVVGATVKDALNTNLGAINANAAAVALKADAAATNAALALKANIASPVFTGDPQAPTPAPGDNDTSIPTTAWVNTAVGAALALKPSVIVSATPPGAPIDNAMWWESDTGYLFLRYNDGNSAQWVQLNGIPTALQANYVAKAGDTMTGALLLAGDPVVPLGASTKQYADTKLPLLGVTDGSNALAGQVGEVISAMIGSSVALATTVVSNVLSISLTAGDWDVSGEIWLTNSAAGATFLGAAITPTSATMPAGSGNYNMSNLRLSGSFPANAHAFGLRPARVNLTATTLYYLTARMDFPSGTATAGATIIARRVR